MCSSIYVLYHMSVTLKRFNYLQEYFGTSNGEKIKTATWSLDKQPILRATGTLYSESYFASH